MKILIEGTKPATKIIIMPKFYKCSSCNTVFEANDNDFIRPRTPLGIGCCKCPVCNLYIDENSNLSIYNLTLLIRDETDKTKKRLYTTMLEELQKAFNG